MAPSSACDQHREHSDVLQIVYKAPNDVAEFLASANYVRSWSVRPSLQPPTAQSGPPTGHSPNTESSECSQELKVQLYETN
jgi:hypothetical protein